MLICCEECKSYVNCARKWILGERGIKSSCCLECEKYNVCIIKNTLERWELIHGKAIDKNKCSKRFTVNY